MKTHVWLCLCMLICGCSSVLVKPTNTGSDEKGVHFFQPTPYLLVTLSEVGEKVVKLTTQVVWLPNMSQEYVLRPKGVFGSSNVKAKFENGWMLTELGIERDSKGPELIKETAGAVGPVLGMQPTQALEPGLYRFVFDETGHVKSLEKVSIARGTDR